MTCQEYHDTLTEQEFSQAAKMSVGMILGCTWLKNGCTRMDANMRGFWAVTKKTMFDIRKYIDLFF